jgi:hypothetical protein
VVDSPPPPEERTDAVTFWGFVVTLAGVLISLLVWLAPGRRRADPRPVPTLLAQAVYGQWRKAADERRLLTPAPIPVHWSLSALDVAGPVVAALGAPDAPPAFGPLSGHTASTEADLHTGGGRRELHALYSGLPSGRIVVVGAPGAGKSGAAILLLLDALQHRDQLDDTARSRCPVPVLFTTHGWDPTTCSVRDWLATRLVAEYPLFQGRSGSAEAAALLDVRDAVALILDGLDEMAPELRPAALQALSDAPFRLVVLTRSPELIQAAARHWLVGAATVQLREVTAPDAADYLHRARTGPPPAGWPDLLTHLREQPDSVLARGLSNPLALTLVRDTYQPGDNVNGLLDTRYHTTKAIEHHLITRVLPAAYTARAGRPLPRYSLSQAHQTLSFLAHRMKQEHTRDLVWWHIPRCAPATPRMLAVGFAGVLTAGLAVIPAVGLAVGLATGLAGVLAVAFGFGLTLGSAVGLAGGSVFAFTIAGVLAVVFAIVFAAGFASVLTRIEPQWARIGNWRTALSRRILRKGLALGLTFGLTFGLTVGLTVSKPQRVRIGNWHTILSRQVLGKGLMFGIAVGLAAGLAVGRTLGLAVGLTVGVATVLIKDGTNETSPLGPREIWRNDLVAGLTLGIAFGLAVGITFGLMVGLTFELAVGLTFGLTFGLAVGLAGALANSAMRSTLAWLQLRFAGRIPAVGLISFLEDARERGVLRTVGGVYQFRHATLQDQLTF